MITTGIVSVRIHDNHWKTHLKGAYCSDKHFLFQALVNHLWLGKSLRDAIAAPVLFVDSQTALTFEPTFDQVKHV